MKTKVLLIQPPWGDVYGGFKSAAKIGNAYPPLGLCYLSSILCENNMLTKIIDAEIEGKNSNDIINEISSFNPDYIGITSTSPTFHIAAELAIDIKRKFDKPVIVGGPHVTVMREKVLEEHVCFDFGVYGEGEKTLLELIKKLNLSQTNFENIEGLIFRSPNGKINTTKYRDYLDFNDLPFPERDNLNLDLYQWSVPGKGIVRFTTIMTSRGCPFSCIFCSTHTIFGKKVRYRNIQLVLDEIEFLIQKYNILHFAFIDDTLTLNHERVNEFCAGVLKRKLKFTWEGWTRANTVNEDILNKLKQSGLVRISFGIESADENILKIIKKGVTTDEMKNAYMAAHKAGIETRGSVILGLPYETKTSAMRTLNFIKHLKTCQQIYINIAVPYPGTKLYDYAKNETGGIKLIENDLSKFKRYSNPVIQVNDLSPNDLTNLQKKGFRMFYFTPSRIIYNIKRAGLKAAFVNALAFIKSVF